MERVGSRRRHSDPTQYSTMDTRNVYVITTQTTNKETNDNVSNIYCQEPAGREKVTVLLTILRIPVQSLLLGPLTRRGCRIDRLLNASDYFTKKQTSYTKITKFSSRGESQTTDPVLSIPTQSVHQPKVIGPPVPRCPQERRSCVKS